MPLNSTPSRSLARTSNEENLNGNLFFWENRRRADQDSTELSDINTTRSW